MENVSKSKIYRHRTAIGRTDFSLPVRLGLELGIIKKDATFFDYGCGRGNDLKLLSKKGYNVSGWDPNFSPDSEKHYSDIVNLGYIVNVIENAQERSQALHSAFSLSRKLLIVSSRLVSESNKLSVDEYMDGVITKRNTFQKFYEQNELRNWIDSTLKCKSVAIAPGIFLVFTEEDERQSFLATRYRRISELPNLRKSDQVFEENRALFENLMEFYAWRGRLPFPDELDCYSDINRIVGSLRRAFRIIINVTNKSEWERIEVDRSQDLLVNIALNQFDGRPRFSELSIELRRDVKAYFSSYKRSCELADKLLFLIGDECLRDELLRNSVIGKLTGNALYIHIDSIHMIHPALRIFEGCARNFVGIIGEANIVKLHRHGPKISYLEYPGFDKNPHPELATSWTVNLQSFNINIRKYSLRENPPILHRKEDFVSEAYRGKEKFSRLTKQEERYGLYDEPSRIGTLKQWELLLKKKKLKYSGHKLIKI